MTEREKKLTHLLQQERKRVDTLSAQMEAPRMKLTISAKGRLVINTGRPGIPPSFTLAECEMMLSDGGARLTRFFTSQRIRMS